MNSLEEQFRSGLRQAVADQPPLGPIDLDEVIARGQAGARLPARRPAPRWLAAAAALALVAGLGVGVATLRPQETVPAVPVGTPSSTAGGAATAGPRLDGTWLANWIRGLDDPVTGSGPGDAPWLRFESATQAVANDVCNPLNADYELSGAELRFGDWTAGTTPCDGSVLEVQQAKKFRAALEGTATVVREGDHLRLQDAKGRDVVRFVREGSASSVPQPTTSPSGVAGTPTSAPAATATTSGIRVRIRNDSSHDLDHFHLIGLDDHVVNFGPVAAGETTGYREVLVAHSRAYFGFRVAGTRPGSDPPFLPRVPDSTDAVKLGPGTYTYVFTLDEENRVGFTLER